MSYPIRAQGDRVREDFVKKEILYTSGRYPDGRPWWQRWQGSSKVIKELFLDRGSEIWEGDLVGAGLHKSLTGTFSFQEKAWSSWPGSRGLITVTPVPLLLYYIPAGREQLPFPGKVAEAEAGCEEMRMPAGSEISLPACLTISPKRMQVPRAGVDKKKKFFFFLKSQLVNILGFLGHMVSVATALRCCWSVEAALDHT